MNKRLKKKNLAYLINNIQKVNLQDGEFLVFKFDTNKYTIEQMNRVAKDIRENISAKVLLVPKDLEMLKVKVK